MAVSKHYDSNRTSTRSGRFPGPNCHPHSRAGVSSGDKPIDARQCGHKQGKANPALSHVEETPDSPTEIWRRP